MSASRGRCISCEGILARLLDFGPQPPCNRYLPEGSDETDRHRLAIAQCQACGLVQLDDPMPPEMVRSRFEWIAYNEPEGHLDALAERLMRLPGIDADSVIVGLTYKDDTTLARLNRLGFPRTSRLDMAVDLGLPDPKAGLESVQAAVRPAKMAQAAARHGQADLLLVRHVLEHAHDPRAFLEGLWKLVKPGGYVVFEMPDSRKFLDACDYSFVWEEHIAYFTPATLASFFKSNGAEVFEVLNYPYALEDSLVGIVRRCEAAQGAAAAEPQEFERTRKFAASFESVRAQIQVQVGALRADGKKVALFGAGHLAAKFLNLFGLASGVECVIDDNQHKKGMRMPGSLLPIKGSGMLDDSPPDLCLLSLSPESERKVLAAKQGYVDRGGRFRSIFALSPLALQGKA